MTTHLRNFLAFFALTAIVGLYSSFSSNQNTEERLAKQAAQLEQSITELDEELKSILNEVVNEEIELSSLRSLWNQRGIGLIIYQDNRGVHWTTNIIPFAESFDDRHKPSDGMVRLMHSWYLCRTVEHDGQLLVAYAFVASDFDFENRYVKNGWSKHIAGNSKFRLTQSELQQFPISINGQESNIGLRVLEKETASGDFDWNSTIWLLFIALLLTTIWYAANWVSTLTSNTVADISFVVLLIILRTLMVWWEMPQGLYATELFGPTPHATSTVIPSLGDLILHLVTFYLIVLCIGKRKWQFENIYPKRFLAVSLPVILIWLLWYLFHILVTNSSFSLDLNSPFSLNAYSFAGLGTSFLGLLIYYLIYRKLTRLLPEDERSWKLILPWLLIGTIVLAVLLGFNAFGMATAIISGLLLAFLMLSQQWLENRSGIYYHAPNVLVFSVIACLMLTDATTQNEHEARATIARKLDQKQNPITEFLFRDLKEEISSDRQLRLALSSEVLNSETVLGNIHQKLGYDHWNRYQNIIDIFNSDGGLMMSDRDRTGPNYFELQSVYENALPSISEGLRYVSAFGVQGGYLARIEIQYPRTKEKLFTFITLIPEKSDDILGFTDLFVDEEYSTSRQLEGYSYAIYQNGELLDHNGDFAYSLSSNSFNHLNGDVKCFNLDGFSHLVTKPLEDRLVIISRPEYGTVNLLTTFSYLFLFYLACTAIIALLSGRLISGIRERTSFRNRINLAMSSVSFISLLLIGVLTVIYVINEYNDRNKEMISEKSKSVLIELEHKLQGRESLEDDKEIINTLLTKFSKVFFTDINLYHLDGHLLATSRPRLFDEGLMAEVIDPHAYEEMRFGQRSSYIHEETIGNLNYLSAYVPFRDKDGQVVAFMSLPYFARQFGLQQEIFSLLATLTNIYVFLILISVVLALFISNRITEPLRIIRESLRNLKLDQSNRAIDWRSNDEIGQLVDEYNRTLNELVRSAELLARSERETAWREMAKQVAHEIKNPLTPMKLSIQMLQRSLSDGAENLDERIERTSKTLIEQIDTLSNIATEFSSFAQMPKSVVEEMNLVDVLKNVADLHKNSEVAVSLELNELGLAKIQADKEQMLRVFTNLVKNGIQAIDNPNSGEVKIGLAELESEWLVSVTDNGSGIPEDLQDKIFVPNFTTKTSGMGLGLAMVKNIVESANGKISFVSEIGSGTTFKVTLPKEDTGL